MGRVRQFIAALILAGFASSATAQDALDSEAALVAVFSMGHAECVASLEIQKTRFSAINARTTIQYEPLNHAYESHRLACDAARLEEESARLLAERQQVEVELLGQDELTTAVGPKFLLKDAERLDEEAATLAAAAENLRAASEGLLVLALRDLDELTEKRRERLLQALDAQSQNDILIRLLGTGGTKAARLDRQVL